MREPLKDWTGRVIGYVDTDSQGNKKLFDWQGRVLGTYNVSLNLTRDFYGRQVGKGDILLTLLK
ncbi:MAG: hypothetical protein K5761_00285 [Clostridiales bacterium]|nr:hypothetical protein [Clostridiales bacterium]